MGELIDPVIDTVLGAVPGGGVAGQALTLVSDVIDVGVGTVEGVGAAALGTVAGITGAQTAQQVAAAAMAGQLPASTMPRPDEGWSGGNGITMKRTIVQTLMIATGRITFTVEPGEPDLMKRDVQIAKRVFRRIRKLEQRLPKKTVKQGAAAQVKEKLNQVILDRITCDVQQKPPC